jgi:hypothetical protein
MNIPDFLQHTKIDYAHLVSESDGVKGNQALCRILLHHSVLFRQHLRHSKLCLLQGRKWYAALQDTCFASHTRARTHTHPHAMIINGLTKPFSHEISLQESSSKQERDIPPSSTLLRLRALRPVCGALPPRPTCTRGITAQARVTCDWGPTHPSLLGLHAHVVDFYL